MAGGRPTKYNLAVLDKVEEYLAMCGREQTCLPTLEGLAIFLGVHTDTIQEWQKQHPEFSLSIKGILDRQKQQLIDDGMYGGKEVNSTMAIFLLKANHNMIETERKMLVGADGKNLTNLIQINESNKPVPVADGSTEGQT
jgi:hypothetical protein